MPASIFTAARLSPFVMPRFTTMMGVRRLRASSRSRTPEFTTRDEPATSSVSAPHHERGRGLVDVGRHELAEEHHVGLQDAAADGARRDHHRLHVVDVDVAVGSGADGGLEVDRRVQLGQAVGDGLARVVLPAGEAEHAVHAAVQLHDVAAAGAPVQAVDVLRHDARHDAGILELGEREVARRWAARCRRPASRGGCPPSTACVRSRRRGTPGTSSACARAHPRRGSRGSRSPSRHPRPSAPPRGRRA